MTEQQQQQQKQPKEGKPLYKILHEHPDFPEIGPEHPYSMFDSVVLSALVYLPILNVPYFGDTKGTKPVTVKDVCTCTLNACLFGDTDYKPCEGEVHNYKRYRSMFKVNNDEKETLKRIKLLISMRECRRYRDLLVSDFLSDYNKAYKSTSATQFAAVTFCAPSAELRIVVIRGTDGTRAGWKEDCMLASTTIASSDISLKYIQGIASKYPTDKLAVVGHSKGGNLALYGALKDPNVMKRIISEPKGVGVINLDGPGLKICDEIDTSKFTQEEHDLITTFIPQTSIIGVTIKGDVKAGEYQCIKSKVDFVMQHCIYTWLFDDTAIPIKAEQDDVSKYFESVFKDIREFGDPEKLTEMVFAIIPGDENDDFMGDGGMSTDVVIAYCINFLALDESFIRELNKVFSDIIMQRLRKTLVPAARNKYYDLVIIASALVTSLAAVSTDVEMNRRLTLVLDGIRKGAQKNLSFADAARYIADDAFKVVAERIQTLCASLSAFLEEHKHLLFNTRKNSAYEVITRVISFMKGIISTAIHTRMVVRTVRKFGYLKDSGEYSPVARESARDMPAGSVLTETVRASTKLLESVIKEHPQVSEATSENGIVLSARTDFGTDSSPKSDLIIELWRPNKMRCCLTLIMIDANDPSESVGVDFPPFRDIPQITTMFQGRQQRTVLSMKAFGIYIARAFPAAKGTTDVPKDATPICQVCVHYLPKVNITAVISGRDIEVDYAPDPRTRALMPFDEFKKASWWLGIFRRDGSIVSCAACGDFDAPGKALIDLPQVEGNYALRFYTSFRAGWYSETPLKIARRHITSLKASRVLIPDATADSTEASKNLAQGKIEICVRWSSWSIYRKMYDWIGLFGNSKDGETLICSGDLADSEEYTVFSGLLRFVLTREEAAALQSIRLYSNGNKDAKERTCLIEELKAGYIEDNEAVYLQRDKSYLTEQRADAFRWTKSDPDRNAIFVVSRSFVPGAVHVMTPGGRYIGIRSENSVACTQQKSNDECFDVVVAGNGVVAFKSHFYGSRYFAVDSWGRLKVTNTIDKESTFAYSKVRKVERYTLYPLDAPGVCLSASSGKSPSVGKSDGKNEMLEIFDLCNNRVLVKLANGSYLSASEKGVLSYSETRGPREVFTVERISEGKKKDLSGKMRLKSSYGQYLLYSERDGLFTTKNDYPGSGAAFSLNKQVVYIQ